MQQELFVRPVVALTTSASRDETGHWRLRIVWQFEGEPWRDADRADFERLSISELVEVVLSTLELGL